VRLSSILRYVARGNRGIAGRIYAGRALVEWGFVFVNNLFGSISLPWPFDPLLVLVCLLRNAVRRNPLVTVCSALYLVLVLYSLDQMAHWFVLLYNSGAAYIAVYLVFAIAPGLFVWRTRLLRLRWYHGIMLGMVGTMSVESTLLVRAPSLSACQQMKANPHVRFLVDRNDFQDWYTIPRFLVMDPEERTVFIGYRYPLHFSSERGGGNRGMIVADRKAHSAKVADLASWEPIGMAFDAQRDSLVAVLVLHGPTLVPDSYHACLAWIARQGEVLQRVPLEDIDRFDYYCAIVPRAEGIVLLDERATLHLYDRDGKRLLRKKWVGEPAPLTNSSTSNGRLFVCYGTTLIHHVFAAGFAAFDLSEFTKLAESRRFLFGTYAISVDTAKKHVYTNSQWSGSLSVFDENLVHIRSIELGNVVRAIALDSTRRRGYASLYTKGELVQFDMDSGSVTGSIRIGKGGRSLYVTRDGEVVAGTGCGVIEIRPEAFVSDVKR